MKYVIFFKLRISVTFIEYIWNEHIYFILWDNSKQQASLTFIAILISRMIMHTFDHFLKFFCGRIAIDWHGYNLVSWQVKLIHQIIPALTNDVTLTINGNFWILRISDFEYSCKIMSSCTKYISFLHKYFKRIELAINNEN